MDASSITVGWGVVISFFGLIFTVFITLLSIVVGYFKHQKKQADERKEDTKERSEKDSKEALLRGEMFSSLKSINKTLGEVKESNDKNTRSSYILEASVREAQKQSKKHSGYLAKLFKDQADLGLNLKVLQNSHDNFHGKCTP